jgi:hypothetical protein
MELVKANIVLELMSDIEYASVGYRMGQMK